MIVLSAIGIGGLRRMGMAVARCPWCFGSGVAMVGLVILFVRYAADPLTEKLAHAPELLVIFAIAMAAMFAAVGDLVGLGKEVGGLLAGVALASTPYRETIAARLAPLRRFSCCCSFSSRLGRGWTCRFWGTHVLGAIIFFGYSC